MTNVWSLPKSESIKLLLLVLQQQLGHDSFCIESEEDNGVFAIMLVKPDQPDVRCYVYSHGQRENHYGIHLEYPRFAENKYIETLQAYENLSMTQIVDTVAIHFEVKNDVAAV